MIAVQSRTRPNRTYTVRWHRTGPVCGVWSCDCTAGAFGRQCWHARAVDELVRGFVETYWGDEAFELNADYYCRMYVLQYPSPIRQVVTVAASAA